MQGRDKQDYGRDIHYLVGKKVTEKHVKDAMVAAKSKFVKAEKEVAKHIKKNPEKAVLIAAGIGAAIGAITALALSKKKN